MVGRWVRHYRRARGMTLAQLSSSVGCAPSHLSLVETGKREPRLSLVSSLARELGVSPADLMTPELPSRRDALELALDRAQQSREYQDLGLPVIRPGRSVPTDVLESLVGLHREVLRRSPTTVTTPEDARRANAELRAEMRSRNNYYPEIEAEATTILDAVGHSGGPVGDRRIAQIAHLLGFTIKHVLELPSAVRSVTDKRNKTIYVGPSSSESHPRSTVLQALGHQLLGHQTPLDFADFLRQRIEVNYFAAAVLVAERQAADLMLRGKEGRYLAVEDLRDAFAVSYETAAHRFTNLATRHLAIPVHFMKAHESGTIYKFYENDDLPITSDTAGSVEGQIACRFRPARMAFNSVSPATSYYQYFDTAAGSFWSAVQTETSLAGKFSVSVGVRFDDARWFRGRDTTLRTVSMCPDPSCCRRPPRDLEERWRDDSWPAARAHAHLLATLPPGAFPGVDDTEVYLFLDRQAVQSDNLRSAGRDARSNGFGASPEGPAATQPDV